MLHVSNLAKSYGETLLFERVHFDVNSGEQIGLVGPNGSGKSTIFALLLRFWDARSGAVTIDGQLSAQFEHTLYVSPEGVEVLTA